MRGNAEESAESGCRELDGKDLEASGVENVFAAAGMRADYNGAWRAMLGSGRNIDDAIGVVKIKLEQTVCSRR